MKFSIELKQLAMSEDALAKRIRDRAGLRGSDAATACESVASLAREAATEHDDETAVTAPHPVLQAAHA